MRCYVMRSKEVNKGTGIETVHFLNDGLWHITTLE